MFDVSACEGRPHGAAPSESVSRLLFYFFSFLSLDRSHFRLTSSRPVGLRQLGPLTHVQLLTTACDQSRLTVS